MGKSEPPPHHEVPADGTVRPLGAARRGDKEVLTDRQRQVLDFIGESIHTRGYPPTLREIGERMGIRSTNGVNDHLKALEKKGYLQRQDLKSRALRVIGAAIRSPAVDDDQTVAVPVLGRVAAGTPILAVEQPEDTVKIDRFFLGNNQPRDVFALRIKGDSMIEAGIFDGDFIFVRKQPTAHPGDIVVAMINEEATVKYFYPETERILFKPANSRMQPIVVNRTEFKPVNLLGTVVGVYRRMC
jgi:repressor LexA